MTDTGRGLTDHAAEAAYTAFVIEAGFAVGPAAGDRGVSAPGPAGHGLRGMRERAAVAGGTIEIGPLPAGGFRVAASLPLDERPGAPGAAPVSARPAGYPGRASYPGGASHRAGTAAPAGTTSPTQKAGR